ncbi:hypothetical protein AVEN_79212-1 [Araneus ventricosus]|uniref:Uncharacterized protein n=1 Tax=Araneus ventricosus TaxID=182803 RepID=A0A4Y2KPJ1_ARAVE|nr:hypothetical protein AVEN_79212-1 [Araneus ventricosus]
MSLVYAECPQDVRDSLEGQYFVDAITDEDTQYATSLMDSKDLKSALAYSMRIEAAKTFPGHLDIVTNGKTFLRSDYVHPGKLTCVRLTGRRLPFLNKAPEKGLKVSVLSGERNCLYFEGYICGIPCWMLVDTGESVILIEASN